MGALVATLGLMVIVIYWDHIEVVGNYLRDRSHMEVKYLRGRLFLLRQLQDNGVVSRETTWGVVEAGLGLIGWGVVRAILGKPKRDGGR